MKYIVAVSGGVDSVVLLDMLASKNEHELIIAHFDHGIRDDSAADARFVEALAKKYGLQYETKREALGKAASEEVARERRYAFLEEMTRKHNGVIVTAHHADDVVETVAINLQRGTGWRGLAVLARSDIHRPLVAMKKRELYDYALAHQLEWVEDSTNTTGDYLRNQVRKQLAVVPDESKKRIVELWNQQREIAQKIDDETQALTTANPEQQRYFYIMIDDAAAVELLRSVLAQQRASLTRPQRYRLLHAIKTQRAGSVSEAGAGVEVAFTWRTFIVKTTS